MPWVPGPSGEEDGAGECWGPCPPSACRRWVRPSVERRLGCRVGTQYPPRPARGRGALTGGEGVELHHGEEAAHGAVEGVQGPRRADTRGQPAGLGRRGERQALRRAEGPAVRRARPPQGQGQGQPQAQQGRQEAGRTHHGVGRWAAGRPDGAQAAESAGRARGRPCILHQPPSRCSRNRPDRFGLPGHPPGARPGQGRRPGLGVGFGGWGAGPGPDPLPAAWGGSLGALFPPQVLLGGLPPELGGEGTSVPLGYLG